MNRVGHVLLLCPALTLLCGALGNPPASGRRLSSRSSVDFAFGSPIFDKFVTDSYHINGGDPKNFYRWFAESFKKVTGSSEGDFFAASRRLLQSSKGQERVLSERKLAATLHAAVRTMMPFFSLERGYEFEEAQCHGKRQCLLQSFLISSMLQKAGLNAGVVAVFRKDTGEESNNGHNVVVLRLSDGADVLIDGSSHEPFVEHHGLFCRRAHGGYLYVEPAYNSSGEITAFRDLATQNVISCSEVAPLDVAYIDAQFDYYRAERTEHGVMSIKPLDGGLRISIHFLQSSVAKCPANALAEYVLGRAYRMTGDKERARQQFRIARKLYAHYGWIPKSVRQAQC